MYCYNCAKKINEKKVEKKLDSHLLTEESKDTTKVAYVCPRCGHLITSDATPEQIKSLARGSHAQLQRARNSFSIGMCMVTIGIILHAIGWLFFTLSRKHGVISPECAEFYVSMALITISVVLLVVGGVYTFLGIRDKHHYTNLLRDINNKTFVQ